MMNRPEMLPCPFCGGRPYLERSFRAFVEGKTSKVVLIRCTQCEARSGRVKLSDYGRTSHSLEAEIDVINAWNRRYNPDA